MKVLDTSAILRSNLDFSDGGYIITNGILHEILDEDLKEIIDLAIGNNHIKVHAPSKKYLKIVEDAARETGDLTSLSSADLEVLAVVLEKKAVLVSDDYAIQNVASALNVRFERTLQEGIKKQFVWEKFCVGCGKKYPAEKTGDCPVCGQKIRRRVK